MYLARHRSAVSRGRRLARVVVLVHVAPLLTLPSMGVARAATNLTCAGFSADPAVQAGCADYSVVMTDLMATLAPGSVEQLASKLATGMRVAGAGGVEALRCELGLTCDAFAVAIAALKITAGTDLAFCAHDPHACAALVTVQQAQDSDRVVLVARQLLDDLVPLPPSERFVQVGISVSRIVSELSDDVASAITDQLLALVILAYEAVPAGSPTNDIVPTTGGAGLGTDSGPAQSAGCGGELESSTGMRVVMLCAHLDLLVGSRKVNCLAKFYYFADLQTYEKEWDNRLFDLGAVHGIVDLTVTPSVKGYTCPETAIEFYGTIYEKMHSNAGSFSSSTEMTELNTQEGVLYSNSWMPIESSINWTHNKVTKTHGPLYIGYTAHFWSPPAGNYESYGTARLKMRNGYKFGDGRSVHEGRNHCAKWGSGETECAFRGY